MKATTKEPTAEEIASALRDCRNASDCDALEDRLIGGSKAWSGGGLTKEDGTPGAPLDVLTSVIFNAYDTEGLGHGTAFAEFVADSFAMFMDEIGSI